MRARTWLAVSAGLNVALAAFLVLPLLQPETTPPQPPQTEAIAPPPDSYVKTNVVVRRQNFTWHEVESDDYATYIKNLRTIGCPEDTIRDIIVADVDQLYAHRRSTEAASNDFAWWRSEPDPIEARRVAAKLAALESERRNLLTRLLGPDWERRRENEGLAARSGIRLAGPLLGDLSDEVKRQVYEIAEKHHTHKESYLNAQRQLGMEADPTELHRLEQALRQDLEGVLDGEQLEEYLLRYSRTADQMRRDFRPVTLSAEEFRAIFRARDQAQQELSLVANDRSAAGVSRFNLIQNHIEETTRRTLGLERYTMFKLHQDPLFRQTKALADRLGATPQVLVAMYAINQETEAERQRIRNDTTLSGPQRIEALAAVQAEQQKSLEELLGEERFERLQQLQTSGLDSAPPRPPMPR